MIQTTTILSALSPLTNLETIQRIRNARRGSRLTWRQGYQNLFNITIEELCQAESLIERGTICFEQYFNRVSGIFLLDWPERGQAKGSSLEYAKMIAGFVKLLQQFISEGLNWQVVQTELENIKDNLIQLRNMQNYDVILFNPEHPDIPDAQPSATDDYRFLNLNRSNPTSIQTVLAQRRRR